MDNFTVRMVTLKSKQANTLLCISCISYPAMPSILRGPVSQTTESNRGNQRIHLMELISMETEPWRLMVAVLPDACNEEHLGSVNKSPKYMLKNPL